MDQNALSTEVETTELDRILCRATLYSALALGFRPPTDETIGRLATPQNTAALGEAAAVLDADEKLGLVSLVQAVAEAGRVGTATLTSSYRALFGHTVRGPIPPYETEYGNEALFQQPQEMGDLMGFYQAFGLTVRVDEHERCDHISCECEFLSFLALKEAYALDHQETEMLEETRKAARLFLQDHLGRFLPAFAKKLSREDRAGFYGTLAKLCLAFVDLESSCFQVAVGAINLGLRPADDDRVPMACGNGAECTAMPGACTPEGADSV
jgi:putative dimethyl sulfoxide reductase chaperone